MVATGTGSFDLVKLTVAVASGVDGIEVDGLGAVGINVGCGESNEQAPNNIVTNMNNPIWKDEFTNFSGI